jgi:hypothetical protein
VQTLLLLLLRYSCLPQEIGHLGPPGTRKIVIYSTRPVPQQQQQQQQQQEGPAAESLNIAVAFEIRTGLWT